MKLADAVEQLRGVGPDEFTATRGALAKELKAAGDAAGAKELTAMRRPPLPVWALNQLSRDDDPALTELFDSVDQLAAAMDGSGDGDADLRGSQRRYWSAIDSAVKAAGGVVTDSGRALSGTAEDQIRATLQAATGDESVGRALLAGELDSLHTPSGFGGVVAVDRPASTSPRSATTSPPTERSTGQATGKTTGKTAKQAVDDAKAEVEAQRRREERDAERERARAVRAHEKLVTRLMKDAERRESEAALLEDEAVRRERLAVQARKQADAAASAAIEVRRQADQAAAEPPE